MTGGCRRRDVSDVALETLRLAWGDAYDIGFEHGRWVATSRGGGPRTVDSDTPAGLNRAIQADWAREARGEVP